MITPLSRHPVRLQSCSHAQRGVVLFIALIVLVAMSLAGIAIMRSVDTSNLISGNIAFKQSTLASADLGIEAAMKYLKDNAKGDRLWSNQEGEAYWASVSSDEDPEWAADSSAWTDAKSVSTGKDKNQIWYVIHRLCSDAGDFGGGGPNCATPPPKKDKRTTMICPARLVYYRITVRVQDRGGIDDDKGTSLSIVQSNVASGTVSPNSYKYYNDCE